MLTKFKVVQRVESETAGGAAPTMPGTTPVQGTVMTNTARVQLQPLHADGITYFGEPIFVQVEALSEVPALGTILVLTVPV